MRRRKLSLPTPEEALEGRELALQSAEEHRSSAITLAAQGQWGHACALLVLAVEESVKSYGLSFISLLPENSAREVEKLLFDHRTRHVYAKAGALWVAFSAVLERVFEEAQDRYPGEEQASLLREYVINALIAYPSAVLAGKVDDSELQDVLSWLDAANELKERGFYVDHGGSGWSSPANVEEAEYRIAEKVATRVLAEVRRLHLMWDDLRPVEKKPLVAALVTAMESALTAQRRKVMSSDS